jgi:hypothetical protein
MWLKTKTPELLLGLSLVFDFEIAGVSLALAFVSWTS